MELIKRLRMALKKNRARVGWGVAEGLIGAAIGLLAATLWGHTVGW